MNEQEQKQLDEEYLKRLTVLYVEDEEETRELFAEFLARPVGTLITATNGVEGLEAFVKHSPDIVITDFFMPEMDGLEMSTRIRALDLYVPILVVSAYDPKYYVTQAIDLENYITKPVNTVWFLDRLYTCVRQMRLAHEPPEKGQTAETAPDVLRSVSAETPLPLQEESLQIPSQQESFVDRLFSTKNLLIAAVVCLLLALVVSLYGRG